MDTFLYFQCYDIMMSLFTCIVRRASMRCWTACGLMELQNQLFCTMPPGVIKCLPQLKPVVAGYTNVQVEKNLLWTQNEQVQKTCEDGGLTQNRVQTVMALGTGRRSSRSKELEFSVFYPIDPCLVSNKSA